MGRGRRSGAGGAVGLGVRTGATPRRGGRAFGIGMRAAGPREQRAGNARGAGGGGRGRRGGVGERRSGEAEGGVAASQRCVPSPQPGRGRVSPDWAFVYL